MTNSKHTRGFWARDVRLAVYAIPHGKHLSTEERQVADCGPRAGGPLTLSECEANAARIVECVNACEGIADPSVVPELVAALESIVSYPDLDSDRPVSGADLVDWLCAELAHFKRVLAKAKGGGK